MGIYTLRSFFRGFGGCSFRIMVRYFPATDSFCATRPIPFARFAADKTRAHGTKCKHTKYLICRVHCRPRLYVSLQSHSQTWICYGGRNIYHWMPCRSIHLNTASALCRRQNTSPRHEMLTYRILSACALFVAGRDDLLWRQEYFSPEDWSHRALQHPLRTLS